MSQVRACNIKYSLVSWNITNLFTGYVTSIFILIKDLTVNDVACRAMIAVAQRFI